MRPQNIAIRSRRLVLAAGVAAALAISASAAAPPSISADRIWFSPGPGSLDYVRLFERPEEWSGSRKLIRVFKLYQGHTQTPPPVSFGPTTYDALVRVDAFRKLRAWGIKTAVEVGAVKSFYCTPDASGMEAAIGETAKSVRAVESAGGVVDYLAMDEPWVSGRATRACGGPALEPTADRVQLYMSTLHQQFPRIRIGLIEAYPFSSAEQIERMLDLMRERGTPPAFLHMDVDWHSLQPGDFARDMRRLQAAAKARSIPFGIIIVGYNGEADALYAVDAVGIANLMADAFTTWDNMPEHIIFQSWVQTSTGLFIIPSNLPEQRLYAHTNLVWNLYRRLRGATGGPIGTAIPRR